MRTSGARNTKPEVMTCPLGARGLRESRWRLALALSAMITALTWCGLASPVGAEEGVRGPRYDSAVLSEIARDVLRRARAGPEDQKPEFTRAVAGTPEEMVNAGTTDDPVPPVTHIAPAQEGLTVAIPPGFAAGAKVISELAPAGYQSNTWRQRPSAARGLSFSSGVLAPASGLDPALKAHAADSLLEAATIRVRFRPAARPAGRGRRTDARPARRRGCSAATTTTTRPACPSPRSRRSPPCPRWSGSA